MTCQHSYARSTLTGTCNSCPQYIIIHHFSVTLALVENDSTIVYYKIFHGLHLPNLPNREARQAER